MSSATTPPSSAWKYAAEFAEFVNCPPVERARVNKRAYRIVHGDLNHRNNFLPPAMIPGAVSVPGIAPCCQHYSLSFFETKRKAQEKIEYLRDIRPLFIVRSGGHVALVSIDEGDGEAGEAGRKSKHFELYEYANADLARKVVSVEVVVQ